MPAHLIIDDTENVTMRGNLRPKFLDGSDDELIAAAQKNDEAAIRSLIRRHNRMLFRLARSILKTDDEAEDAVQAAYVRAFTQLASFRGDARLSTWLGRIVVNEALGRIRQQRPVAGLEIVECINSGQVVPFPLRDASADPEQTMTLQQTRRILERAIDALPNPFRIVLVARLVEEMSVQETASLLGIRTETVKTRLHRARALLRVALEKEMGPILPDVFTFGGARCQRIADRVVAQLRFDT
jgi:RNA polymerase sigma-70 factor (ECF subfamily)